VVLAPGLPCPGMILGRELSRLVRKRWSGWVARMKSGARRACGRWSKQLQYETLRAFEQYDKVDPRNWLVSLELERRWNEKLHELEGSARLPGGARASAFSVSARIAKGCFRWAGPFARCGTVSTPDGAEEEDRADGGRGSDRARGRGRPETSLRDSIGAEERTPNSRWTSLVTAPRARRRRWKRWM
jgi:hypothetical protein